MNWNAQRVSAVLVAAVAVDRASRDAPPYACGEPGALYNRE